MSFQQPRNVQAVIRVIGVGGGGSNAIDRMIEDGVQDVTFVAINTDAQVLRNSKADFRICIGERLTRGMGAGGDPTVGEKAAEETNDELYEILKGTDMVFITAGMGGGTGTGAAPIVASIAQDLGILTVAVVTKPFKFEGNKRLLQAERGIEHLRKYVDALVVVPNDRLVEAYAKRGISILQGFQIVDGVLRQGIQGVADLITKTGVVNVDFADVKTVLANSGEALMSIGIGAGENRIQQAIEAAMNSPLLDVEIRGAKRILLNITSNENIKLSEISEAANTIESIVDPEANIIWGSVIDYNFPADQVKITLVATGISNFRQKTQLPLRQATREPEKPNAAPDVAAHAQMGSESRDARDMRTIRPFATPQSVPLPPANQPRSDSPLSGGRRSDDNNQRPYEENPNITIPPGLRDDFRRKN
ncbi:MAG: cell division protein FtsZ [Chloroflexales bacterium]|nr:cell division protein FtsZ [Chloroflexales bacterium]